MRSENTKVLYGPFEAKSGEEVAIGNAKLKLDIDSKGTARFLFLQSNKIAGTVPNFRKAGSCQIGGIDFTLTFGGAPEPAAVAMERGDRSYDIEARGGLSSFTGMLGCELQVQHFAYTLGWMPFEETAYVIGAKYYQLLEDNSWFGGVCLSYGTDEYGLGGGKDTWITLGFAAGYRWRWEDGWSASVAGGPGYALKEDEWGDTDDSGFWPAFEISVGYAF